VTHLQSYSGNCPCLSGDQYVDCCGRFHSASARAATAEQLMRSRYSAFVLLDTGIEWRRLDIMSTQRGGPLDNQGTVEFKAHFRQGGERGVHHETSRFIKAGGQWYYLDAVALHQS
jgi:SEC-C motif domain protein